MAQKTKDKTKIPSKKEATIDPIPSPWPNLPTQLIGLIGRQPNLMQNITSFGCVIKSWRSTPRQCSIVDGKSPFPQLVEIIVKEQDKFHKNRRSHILNISFPEEFGWYYYKRKKYKSWCPGIYFKGHSHRRIVVMEANLSVCSMWEPAKRCTGYLPSWDLNIPFKVATLSSPPDYPNECNVMVLTGISCPAFAFFRCQKSQKGWILENCTFKDPYAPNQLMNFTSAIGFQGKFYALSLQGCLVVIEDIDSCFRITGFGANRAVPSVLSRQFREYLVESNGEIFLVFLISRKSIDVVEDVEVFQLDVTKLLWVKIESLRDKTLFLEDECCMWVTASDVGSKKNCIYFTHHRVDKWWIFDMETCSISSASGSNDKKTDSVTLDEPMKQE